MILVCHWLPAGDSSEHHIVSNWLNTQQGSNKICAKHSAPSEPLVECEDQECLAWDR